MPKKKGKLAKTANPCRYHLRNVMLFQKTLKEFPIQKGSFTCVFSWTRRIGYCEWGNCFATCHRKVLSKATIYSNHVIQMYECVGSWAAKPRSREEQCGRKYDHKVKLRWHISSPMKGRAILWGYQIDFHSLQSTLPGVHASISLILLSSNFFASSCCNGVLQIFLHDWLDFVQSTCFFMLLEHQTEALI